MGRLEMGLKGWVEIQQRQKSRALLLPPAHKNLHLRTAQPGKQPSLVCSMALRSRGKEEEEPLECATWW